MKNSLKTNDKQEVFTKDGFNNVASLTNRIGKDYTLDGYVEYVFVKSTYEKFVNEKDVSDEKLVKNVTEKLILLNAENESIEQRKNLYSDCKAVVKFITLKNSLCSFKKSKKAKRPEVIRLLKNGESIISSKKDLSVADHTTVEILVKEFLAQRTKSTTVKKEKPHEAISNFMFKKDLSAADVCRATIFRDTEMSHQDFYKYTHPKKTVKPSRSRIIRMAFGLRLTLEETKYLVSLYNVKSFPEEGSEKDRLVCVSLQNGYTFAEFCEAYEEIFDKPFITVKSSR